MINDRRQIAPAPRRGVVSAGHWMALSLCLVVSTAWGATTYDAREIRSRLESQGFTSPQAQAALALLDRADARAIPAGYLADRIREGLARRAAPADIVAVVGDRLADLERADGVARRCAERGIPLRERDQSLVSLAQSFSLGITPDDVLTIAPASANANRNLASIAHGAEVMGRLGRAGMAPAVTRGALAAAMERGWSRHDIDDLPALFAEARQRHIDASEAGRILADGIRANKDHSSLLEDASSNPSSSSSHEPSTSHSSSEHSPSSNSSTHSSQGSSGRGQGGGAGGGKGGGHGPSNHGRTAPHGNPNPKPQPPHSHRH